MLAPNVDLKLVANMIEIQAVRRNWQLTPLLCTTVFQIIYMVIYNRSWIAERDIFHIGADRPERAHLPDVEVDTWPVREIFRGKLLQIDGCVRNNGMSYKLNFMCLFLFDLM